MSFLNKLTAAYLGRPPEQRDLTADIGYSIVDPRVASYFGLVGATSTNINVNEWTALSSTPLYRCISLIAGTLASLDLKTYREQPDGTRVQVSSILDNPCPLNQLSPFEWKELLFTHLLLQGNSYLRHDYNGAGQLINLYPVHPLSVLVKWQDGQKTFEVSMMGGTCKTYTEDDMTQFMMMSLDGIRGVSPIYATKNAIGISMAADEAAGRIWANGLMMGGIVSMPGATPEQMDQVKSGMQQKYAGSRNAGSLGVINQEISLSPWTMSPEDAQFIQARAFQVEEIARIFGVPKELLGAAGATSWGTGIQQLIQGFWRFTLAPLAARVECRLNGLLPNKNYCKFDYESILEPSPLEQVQQMAVELNWAMLTHAEARAKLHRSPMTDQEMTEWTALMADKPKSTAATE